jgi:hypothetical protein
MSVIICPLQAISADPETMRSTDSHNEAVVVISDEGRGRFFVRSILESHSFSWYWLSAEAPAARRKIPEKGRRSRREKPLRQISPEAYAEKVTARETLNRIKARKLLNEKDRKNYFIVLR